MLNISIHVLCSLLLASPLIAQSPNSSSNKTPKRTAPQGSLVEDRAARKLLQAGEARIELGENQKALEIWQSVIERYPRSRVRFLAHLKLGDHLLKEAKDYEKARRHYQAAADEGNQDEENRCYAHLHMGVCYYQGGNYGKCFNIMRDLIKQFPNAQEVNEAYYYIGLGHFKLNHYSRAIEALEKVGTAISAKDSLVEKVEAGKQLFIRLDDQDFAILDAGSRIKVICKTKGGDQEVVFCDPIGRKARIALGRIKTDLNPAKPNNGILEVRGGDLVTISYVDAHTAEKEFGKKRTKQVAVVGNGVVRITDGSYQRDLPAAVLGKPLHLQIIDADHDTTDQADHIDAKVVILRRKTGDEIDDELAKRVASGELSETEDGDNLRSLINPLLMVRSVPVKLREQKQRGTFRLSIPLRLGATAGGIAGEAGQTIRLIYQDEQNLTGKAISRTAETNIIEGNLGEVRVTRADISDEELRLKTRLKTASALTEVGNYYKDFGLDQKAKLKYAEALQACEKIHSEANQVGGKLLEETYVQLWRIYFAMDQLDLALGMSRRLLREFPESSFVDEAMLQQAHVERKRENYPQAIALYTSITRLKSSPLRGESQFSIAECYEAMAIKAPANKSKPLFERAFTAYHKVFEQFPDSGRVGDAVAKMAAFYYKKKDYARAVDVFENVLSDHPDANFLDVILFNYGRCLYKLNRKAEARRKFEQLINDYPESDIASEANKIVEALTKAGF